MVTMTQKTTSLTDPIIQFTCLSTDVKPDEAPHNALLFELDTGNKYFYSDGVWHIMPSVVGGGNSGIVPAGTLSITRNGTVDVTRYASANVQVPQPSGTIHITQNGHIDVLQYESADVNVAGNATEPYIEYTMNANGTAVVGVSVSGFGKLPTNIFANLNAMTSVSFANSPNIDAILSSAFSGCSALQSIAIPDSIVSIGTTSFANCSMLRSVVFKGYPTTIAANAFAGCNNLLDIYAPWSMDTVPNAPWGAVNAVIHYDYTPQGG